MLLSWAVAFDWKASLRLRVELWGLAAAAGTLVWIATLAGFAASLGWLFEIACHFRLQYAVILAFLTIAFALRRMPVAAGLFAIGALINLLVLGLYLVPANRSSVSSGKPFRLLLLNVNTQNPHHARVIAFVRAQAPDIAAFLEVDPAWFDALSTLRTEYPHLVAEPRDDNFGIALFSRLPLLPGQIVYLGQAGVPSIRAELILPGSDELRPILPADSAIIGPSAVLLVTHPLPPGSLESFRLRNEQLQALGQTIAMIDQPVILLGDLNVTPWSPHFRNLLRQSGLEDTGRGRSLRGTWPAHIPPLRIPLDHCLVSPGFRVIERQVGPRLGSDHLPLLITLQPKS